MAGNDFNNKINMLKDEFNILKGYKTDIKFIFDSLNFKINKLKELYNDFLNENRSNLFIFGLDSFKFQNKLIDVEHENMKKNYYLISNRMYCDYYKLHSIIIEFINKSIDNVKLKNLIKYANKKYDKYDYLDIYKQYDFNVTIEIFDDIINYILSMVDYLKILVIQLDKYNSKKNTGLNINNFIYTFDYNKSLLKEQIALYINYLDFFLKLHSKYLTQFIEKLTIMYQQINRDIKIEDSNINQKIKQLTQDKGSIIERTNQLKENNDTVEISEKNEKELINTIVDGNVIIKK